MRWRLRPRGLRARIVVGFAAGTLLVSAVLVATTFLLARNYLLDQRESAITRQAFADANLLRSGLSTAGAEVGDTLAELFPAGGSAAGGSAVVVRKGGAWYSSSLDVGARDVPADLLRVVEGGDAARLRTGSPEGPRLVVGLAVPAAGVEVFQVAPLTELQLSLRTLAAVLGAGALAATAAGAAFGAWASRRAVQPLEQVAGAATSIAGGELTTRLPATDDPDLVAIVGSFNSMVDALAARLDRDARFVGDVSHELRSPLTTLTTAVEVMGGRREELSARGRQALALIEAELRRFRRTLDDLLELARLDADTSGELPPPVDLGEVVREVLARTGRPADLLTAGAGAPTRVRAGKSTVERAVVNLLDNADRHAGGARRVTVQQRDGSVLLHVDDAGPGVPPADRDRVFERFARGPRTARGSLAGAGLGLAIVAETAARHGGAAWCSASAEGGARFSLALPAADPEARS